MDQKRLEIDGISWGFGSVETSAKFQTARTLQNTRGVSSTSNVTRYIPSVLKDLKVPGKSEYFKKFKRCKLFPKNLNIRRVQRITGKFDSPTSSKTRKSFKMVQEGCSIFGELEEIGEFRAGKVSGNSMKRRMSNILINTKSSCRTPIQHTERGDFESCKRFRDTKIPLKLTLKTWYFNQSCSEPSSL